MIHGMIVAKSEDMKNFHLPLPEQTYTHLRAEAERAQVPATELARTEFDLDPDLEAAGVEHLVNPGKAKR